MSLEN